MTELSIEQEYASILAAYQNYKRFYEAAEARAAQLEAERDEARRKLDQARKWASAWKNSARWHSMRSVISFGE